MCWFNGIHCGGLRAGLWGAVMGSESVEGGDSGV